MNQKLKYSSSNIFVLFLLQIIIKLEIYYGQIYDNFTFKVLEEDSEVLDINDYI